MAKYDPLRELLRRQRPERLELTFREIEGRIGYLLPNSAMKSDWWVCDEDSEPGPREVQKQAWRAAGYDASLLVGERVLFTRRAASDVA